MLLDRKYLPTALVLACLFICPQVQATSFTGPVVSVPDSDTIEVLHNNHAELLKAGAFLLDEMTPQLSVHGVKMTVLMIQVKDDAWTKNPEDGQKTFDLLGSKDKELFWIEGTTRRLKAGYNLFWKISRKDHCVL
jgi:hypothetical protein